MCFLENILYSNLMASVVVGLITLLGVYLTLRGQRQCDKDRQEEIIQGVLQALYEELKEVWERLDEVAVDYWKKYEEEKGNKKRSIFSCHLTVSQDYLTIYRSNANLIGQIKRSELRRKIVRVYTLLQALVEGYRINTEFLDKCEEADIRWQAAEAKGDEAEVKANKVLYERFYSKLEKYAPQLQKEHKYLKQLIEEDLLEMLREEFSKCRI